MKWLKNICLKQKTPQILWVCKSIALEMKYVAEPSVILILCFKLL